MHCIPLFSRIAVVSLLNALNNKILQRCRNGIGECNEYTYTVVMSLLIALNTLCSAIMRSLFSELNKGPSLIVNIYFCMLIAYKRVVGWFAKTSVADNIDMIVFFS